MISILIMKILKILIDDIKNSKNPTDFFYNKELDKNIINENIINIYNNIIYNNLIVNSFSKENKNRIIINEDRNDNLNVSKDI